MKARARKRAASTNWDSVADELEDLTEDEVSGMKLADFKFSPQLVEQVRKRHRLKLLSLRIGEEQIAVARAVAADTGEPYQTVLRRWLAEGAEREVATVRRSVRTIAHPARKRPAQKRAR